MWQLVWGWFNWWERGLGDGLGFPISYRQLLDNIAVDHLGPELEAWTNPRLAAQFFLACVEFVEGDAQWWEFEYPFHLTRKGKWMSESWGDRDKARRFVDFLRTHQIPRDEALLADPDWGPGSRGPYGILGQRLGEP